jgi:OmpA-OmpF porin, OOP family
MNTPLSPFTPFVRLGGRLFFAGMVLCTAALAIAQNAPRSSREDLTVGYVGLQGGPSDFSRSNGGNGLFSSEDRNTAYSLTLGNYFFNSNMGMEVGYTNFGQVSRGGGTTKAEGINISLIGKMPLSPSFNLLGKVGTTYGHTEVSSQPASGIAQGSESGFDWSYGVGAELVFNPLWSAVLQYDEHFMKFVGNGSDRLSTTTIGMRMRF